MANDALDPDNGKLLSPEEVGIILSAASDYEPIVVGGQCISMWVDYFSTFDEEIAGLGSVSSADVDYFENPEAAQRLKEKLDGKILWPEDAISLSPNSCTVTAVIGGKQIHIDFMRSVLGVDTKTLKGRSIVISGHFPNIEEEVHLALMHPLDCIQSRLANIEKIARHDPHSLAQTDASFKVYGAFIRQLMEIDVREACRAILAFEPVLRDSFYRPAVYPHVANLVLPAEIVAPYIENELIDIRWRKNQLTKMISNLAEYESKVKRQLGI